ncbi:MAG: polysaccharide deacetylase family protein [Bacteroidetes bacterium]|nr:polysaccharide deacetylase family protein [Bacteroidota bacterium]
MKTKYFLLLALSFIGCSLRAQQTVQEKLGYPKNTKLLILHGDDIGVSHSQNMASLTALEKGYISSGSIMVPCPWFPEVAAYAVAHPAADLGLHLTLTSEWKYYRWGTVSSKEKSPSLVNKNGFLYDDTDSLGKMATAKDVEQELRAQIDRAIQFGIHPTHFDSHMAGCFFNKEYLKVYIKLAREYHVPCLLNKEAFKFLFNINLDELTTSSDVIVDKIFMAYPDDYKRGMANYYTKVITSLQPGLNCILLHAAFDNDEMRAVTIDHPDYGAAWRQADFDFFSSDACKKLLAEQNIHLITWKEIKEKLVK